MTSFKSFNNIVLEMIQQLQLTEPSLDVKPGSVARDLFIDLQAQQISNLYDALNTISSMQSITNINGQDLINYGANFGVVKNSGTKASGTATLTFRSIDVDIPIPSGSVIRSRSGIPFLTISAVTIYTSQTNAYRANATRIRQQLNTAGITDEFSIDVSVEAQSPGSLGNVATYALISQSIAGVNGVTNISSFSGGSDVESDAAFRSRILATFAGANVGTALGYRSVVLGLASAIDALVIEPGDPLMTRDGTVTGTDSSGNLIVSQPGTGGRVDIYVMGENPQAGIDSFLYYDKSGKNDPTDSDNDFILGHSSLTASTALSINSRRVATLSEGAAVPQQPVSNIVSVSGSSSGPNFTEQYLNSVGNYEGNYKLEKDTGSAGGSPFGLDKLVWTSDRIELSGESITKGALNNIDGLLFDDVIEISEIQQDIQIVNENSTKSSSRSTIILKHTPVRTVTRVFNFTTGERYIITDQNPSGTGSINLTGDITISGRTLPVSSDILQVDYAWVYSYDSAVDYDNLDPKDSLNTAQDSVEWGFSNYIRGESESVILDPYNNLTLTTKYNISRVLSVNVPTTETLTVQGTSLAKTVTVSNAITSIYKVTDNTLNYVEVYNTFLSDGTFSNRLISLPSDTLAEVGDSVTVMYNLYDISNIDGYSSASVTNNVVTLYPYYIVATGTQVLVNYVCDFSNILEQVNISSLPVSGDGLNSFTGADGYQPFLNTFSGTSVVSNQRRSPSNLLISITGIPSSGIIRPVGTTINKVTDTITATNTTIDLASLIKEDAGLSSTAALPSTYYVSRVVSVEQVTLDITGAVKTINYTYDLQNYKIKESKWDKANAISDANLSNSVVVLASNITNEAEPIETGLHLQVSFYYVKENDYEDMFFSSSGSAFTNKKFAYISSVNRLAGFQDANGTISGKLIIDSNNQPATNSSYSVDYSYTAPKENERITVNYEFNKLIVDATEAVESKRPITADVLVKSATKIELDVTATIIVLPSFLTQQETVKQDVIDNITSTLTANSLGTTLDSSDVVNGAYNIAGLDRIVITRFNKTGVLGTKTSITASKNEYLASGVVSVTVEDR